MALEKGTQPMTNGKLCTFKNRNRECSLLKFLKFENVHIFMYKYVMAFNHVSATRDSTPRRNAIVRGRPPLGKNI